MLAYLVIKSKLPKLIYIKLNSNSNSEDEFELGKTWSYREWWQYTKGHLRLKCARQTMYLYCCPQAWAVNYWKLWTFDAKDHLLDRGGIESPENFIYNHICRQLWNESLSCLALLSHLSVSGKMLLSKLILSMVEHIEKWCLIGPAAYKFDSWWLQCFITYACKVLPCIIN